ncbi:MFS transporter [Ornithinimicrobium sp. W1665]|uniref:MFS transporter n=1 Tax=Ornithinimicrobium sp. W1665 TaxID=3416666 RepID=UPI003CFB1DF7
MGRTPGGEPFRLRDVALAAFLPTIVSGTGHAALLPVLALFARDLGADVGQAALVVALLGVGSLVASLPAGALVARVGERRALVGAGVVDAAAMALAAGATSVPVLMAAVVLSGASWSVFLLARQGFLIAVSPAHLLARAMSTLGGSHRVGAFLGPVAGAALLASTGSLRSVFWLAAVLALLSGLVVLLVPDLQARSGARPGSGGLATRADAPQGDGTGRAAARPRVLAVLTAHRHVLLTLGSAVVVIGAARSLRATVLPLWADHVGISAEATSLVFGVAALVEIALFYPAGWLMDRRGRTLVAVPVVATIGLGVALLPLAAGLPVFVGLAVLMALGNGMGSGIVMTLGADSAPSAGRSQFLGGWRLAGDLGSAGGPLVVAVLASVVPLATACVITGVAVVAGSGWVRHWVARAEARRSAR